MIRTLLWFAYFWILLIGTLPKLLLAGRMEKAGNSKEHDRLAEDVPRVWARRLLWAAGARVEVEGLDKIPKDRTVLFVSNHQGNFDIPLLMGKLPVAKGFVAKKELKKLPILSSWMVRMRCVFLDRSDIRQSLVVINEAVSYLKKGHSMVLFPEGTRSKGPEMGEFKAGSLKLAMKAQVPIVPVAIDGSYRLMEAQGFWIRPATVNIRELDMIETKGLDKEEARDLPRRVKETIQDALANAD